MGDLGNGEYLGAQADGGAAGRSERRRIRIGARRTGVAPDALALALGIGAVIGAGIFVLTGHAAAHAGPAVSLSFVLAGVVCAFAGLCYAEMASTVPVAGSAYTYAYATMGEFIAWIIGWDLILEYAFGATTVAIGWSGYVTSLLSDLGVAIPAKFALGPLAYDPAAGSWSPTADLIGIARLTRKPSQQSSVNVKRPI
jgi:amino acid transporter